MITICYQATKVYSEGKISQNSLFVENLEALSDNPEQNSYMYPHRKGTPAKCTLYVYINLETGLTIPAGSFEDGALSGSVKFEKKKITGAEDYCKDKGDGCDLFTCREVPGPTSN